MYQLFRNKKSSTPHTRREVRGCLVDSEISCGISFVIICITHSLFYGCSPCHISLLLISCYTLILIAGLTNSQGSNLHRNCSLILNFYRLMREATNKISTKNRNQPINTMSNPVSPWSQYIVLLKTGDNGHLLSPLLRCIVLLKSGDNRYHVVFCTKNFLE